MTTAFDRSPTFRALVGRIERSDVIVYLTCARFETATLNGRTLLTAAGIYGRYVRVQIRCQQSPNAVAAIVAHELEFSHHPLVGQQASDRADHRWGGQAAETGRVQALDGHSVGRH